MADEGHEDDEWEEEECLILVELVGVIDFDDITSSDPKKCNILGLDSDRPLLQLDRCLFMGEYKEAVGTIMLFEESQGDPNSEIKRKIKYTGKTFKKLQMRRAFISDKADASQESQGSFSFDGAQMEESVTQAEHNPQETFVETAEDSVVGGLSVDLTNTSLGDIPEPGQEITGAVKKPKFDNDNIDPP